MIKFFFQIVPTGIYMLIGTNYLTKLDKISFNIPNDKIFFQIVPSEIMQKFEPNSQFNFSPDDNFFLNCTIQNNAQWD